MRVQALGAWKTDTDGGASGRGLHVAGVTEPGKPQVEHNPPPWAPGWGQTAGLAGCPAPPSSRAAALPPGGVTGPGEVPRGFVAAAVAGLHLHGVQINKRSPPESGAWRPAGVPQPYFSPQLQAQHREVHPTGSEC